MAFSKKLPLANLAALPLAKKFGFYRLIRPLLFRMDPENAHNLTLKMLKKGLVPKYKPVINRRLNTDICGIHFPNPVGLAAGFDKNAQAIKELRQLGFGFVEVGSITPLPQDGNPKPRLFRLPEADAVINRFGFNSLGMEYCFREIIAWHDSLLATDRGILGVNLGKNKTTTDAAADYVAGLFAFAPYADYLTINISSPNTPGLRDLQGRDALIDLLQKVMSAHAQTSKKPPVFVKIAPDQTTQQMEDIADAVTATGVHGLIVGNTTVSRPGTLPAKLAAETGGLSGKPLFTLSTKVLADMYRLTRGKLPIIGCGGVSSAEDAYAKIRAGASLVQLYTALIYEGPALINRINNGLAALLERDGFASVNEAVGKDVKL